MKYSAIAILSIASISASHYGIPHDFTDEATTEDIVPVVEPENDGA